MSGDKWAGLVSGAGEQSGCVASGGDRGGQRLGLELDEGENLDEEALDEEEYLQEELELEEEDEELRVQPGEHATSWPAGKECTCSASGRSGALLRGWPADEGECNEFEPEAASGDELGPSECEWPVVKLQENPLNFCPLGQQERQERATILGAGLQALETSSGQIEAKFPRTKSNGDLSKLDAGEQRDSLEQLGPFGRQPSQLEEISAANQAPASSSLNHDNGHHHHEVEQDNAQPDESSVVERRSRLFSLSSEQLDRRAAIKLVSLQREFLVQSERERLDRVWGQISTG